MVTWLIKCMNMVSPYDLIEREVAADSAADAMAISDFEKDDYLAISARFKNDHGASAQTG